MIGREVDMKDIVLKLLERKRYKEARDFLLEMYPVDIADALQTLDYKELLLIFRLLPKEEAAETFAYMNIEMQEVLINALTDAEIREVIDEMFLDDTVDMLEEMPANVVDRILMVTDSETRKQINQLLNYPEDSAGSIMTTEYVSLQRDMTVAEAIQKIRHIGIASETIYTCYVTERRKLIGYVDIKELLISSDQKLIEDIMDTNIICVDTNDDQEDVLKIFKKYGMIAVPVVDKTLCIVGIVTVDDVMLIQQEEGTEDIVKMAAVTPSQESYFGTNVFQHAKNRSVWLVILMITSSITGVWMTQYSESLAMIPLVSAMIPMIMGTGGNSGSQTSTLMIRGMAVDEIHLGDVWRILWKEFRISLIVGVILGIANGIRIQLMYHDTLMAFTVFITLIATIIMAKMVGCVLPLMAKRIHVDPALMAAPLITTLLDAGAIVVYYQIVIYVYRL